MVQLGEQIFHLKLVHVDLFHVHFQDLEQAVHLLVHVVGLHHCLQLSKIT